MSALDYSPSGRFKETLQPSKPEKSDHIILSWCSIVGLASPSECNPCRAEVDLWSIHIGSESLPAQNALVRQCS